MNEATKVLTLKIGPSILEVYMLNPGQRFDGFGGSRGGLTVSKTASLIVRTSHGPMSMIRDTELDITDDWFWQTIAKCINAGEPDALKATAETKAVCQ